MLPQRLHEGIGNDALKGQKIDPDELAESPRQGARASGPISGTSGTGRARAEGWPRPTPPGLFGHEQSQPSGELVESGLAAPVAGKPHAA